MVARERRDARLYTIAEMQEILVCRDEAGLSRRRRLSPALFIHYLDSNGIAILDRVQPFDVIEQLLWMSLYCVASQQRWLAKAANRDYFRGPENVANIIWMSL